MPPVQTTYLDEMPIAKAGALADMATRTLISRTVEASGGLAFGVPIEFTANNSCKLFDGGTVHGVSVLERSLSAGANAYVQYESARILTEGAIWVVAAQDVVAGDPVYVRPSNGDWQKDNTNSAVLYAGAVFETAASATGLARIRIR